MGVQNELGLKRWEVSGEQVETDRTHVEDLEEPVQVRFPRRNRVLVTPGVDKSSEPVSFASFDNPPLYLCNGPTIPSTISGRAVYMYRWPDLRCELIYRVAHRFAEIAQFLPAHSLLKGFAYIGAVQTKIDIVLIVGHRVL